PPLSLKRLALINSAFEKLDKDGDGLISMKDMDRVYDYLQNSDFRNEDQAKVFDEFLNVFELFGHGDGKALSIEEALGLIDFVVSKEEFFNYCCGISASIDNDAQFERVMMDAWQ
ncbi:calcyphosin, partial [Aphelenchoides avenae]